MKIIQVCGYYPPHIGGIEYCVKNISEQLARNGHEVTVFTSDIGAKGRGRLKDSRRLKQHYLRSFEFAHTPFIPSLPFKLLRTDRDSLLHIHLSHVYTELTVFAVAKLRRLPYVAHFHMDVDVSGRFGVIFKLYKKTLLPFVIRRAAQVITLSEEQRQLVIERYKAKPERVCVIPNGASAEFFSTKRRTFRSKPVKLLFVGRFALQKNVPRLLKALPLIKNPVELHLVGDGEKRSEIEGLIKQLSLQNVKLHGRQGGRKLIASYEDADIFVVPSDREGMPLTLIEAAASGLPIVASKVQGLREFVGSVGVLVDRPSPKNFAREIDKLIDNPNRLKSLSAASRKWANDYSWSNLVKEIERVYAEARND